jgi:hypothetical protein
MRRSNAPFSAGDPVRRISPTAAFLLCARELREREPSQLETRIFMLPPNFHHISSSLRSVIPICRRVARSVDIRITCLPRGVVIVSDETDYSTWLSSVLRAQLHCLDGRVTIGRYRLGRPSVYFSVRGLEWLIASCSFRTDAFCGCCASELINRGGYTSLGLRW